MLTRAAVTARPSNAFWIHIAKVKERKSSENPPMPTARPSGKLWIIIVSTNKAIFLLL